MTFARAAGLIALALSGTHAGVPSVALRNAAQPGLTMPAIGLGTGAYSDNPLGYDVYPQCWVTSAGCGAWVERAVSEFISVGGRRIDSANSYQNQVSVGNALAAAIAAGNVTRGELFVLSKVGPSNPLGYNDSLAQFDGILRDLQTPYVDALLVHWPWESASKGNVTNNATVSTDPLCNRTSAAYSEAGCRLSTWRAVVDIWRSGRALAIGVSNYNVSHFEEIAAAGLPLPSLTQSPFHLYRSATQMDLVDYCLAHDIVFLGYSPFGVPDYKVYPTAGGVLPAANQLQDPVVLAAAAAHGATPAQVLLAWQWALGIPANPRSMNATHMADNLAAYDLVLTQEEIDALSARPQDMCAFDPGWYECSP